MIFLVVVAVVSVQGTFTLVVFVCCRGVGRFCVTLCWKVAPVCVECLRYLAVGVALAWRRIVQRRISSHLNPLPVLAGMLDNTRDWKNWLAPLDDIHHKTGVENIMNSGMHWIAFSRRSDVVVGVPMEEVGLASAPGDVMAMVKRFMSDGQLCQPAFTFIRAGASSLLPHPTGPNTWVPRDAFTTIDHNNFTRFSGKVHRLLRGKIGALQYLKDWMGKPVQPNTPPDAPLCFQARSVAQGQDFATALEQAVRVGQDEFRPIGVKRRRVDASHRRIDMPLPQYLETRSSQGVSIEQAVQEWNGGQLSTP